MQVLDRSRVIYRQLPQEPPAFAHGDYKADHLWFGAKGVTLIDFDSSRLADPAADLGKFLADLRWWYLDSGHDGVERAQAEFLAAYAPTRECALRARVYEALSLAKIAVRRVRLFSDDWARRTEYWLVCADGVLRSVASGLPADALPRPGKDNEP